MRLIISGAGGFLGRNIVHRAVEEKMDVVALTSKNSQLGEEYRNNGNVTVVGKYEYKAIEHIGETVLINCAFPMDMQGASLAGGMNYIRDLLMYFDSCCSAVINISSQSVYSQDKEKPSLESDGLKLETQYALGKYMTEMLTEIICRSVPHANVRMASLHGKGSDKRIVNRMIEKVKNGEGIELHIGDQFFGYMDVRDAAEALILLSRYMLTHTGEEERDCTDNVYNLGIEGGYSMDDIGRVIEEKALKVGLSISVKRLAVDIRSDSTLDSSKLYKTINWKPKYSLPDTVDWIWDG